MAQGLSVIIPAKNEEKFIEGCIQALKTSLQTIGESEIIVVDNGSSDRTCAIASNLGCIVISEPTGNISKLRNTGAHKARFDMLAFVDADCLVHPSWARFCLQHFHNIDIGIVGTQAAPDLDNATWVEEGIYSLFAGSVTRPDYVEWLGTSNMVIPQELFWTAGGFNERLETAEDVALCTAVKKKQKKIFLDKRITTVHLRESKNLQELFARERWRGKNSISSFITNNFPKEEILSVLGPVVVLFFYLLTFLLLCVPTLQKKAIFPLSIIILIPVLFLTKKVKLNSIQPQAWLRMYVVSFVYISARTLALAVECFFLARKKIKLK